MESIEPLKGNLKLIHGDQIPANGLTIADLDLDAFKQFFEKEYGESVESQEIPLANLLENMNLMNGGVFNIAGALLFAKRTQFKLPIFIVKAVCYPDIDIHQDTYIENQDISGKLFIVFQDSLSFIKRQLRRLQAGQNVNSLGKLEIPEIVLEELLVNALIHRDYFISAPIRIFVFTNRIEIISPGHLPHNLTIANIKTGNSNIRNPILASFATKILPYRGLGSGIIRAIKAYPDIEFIDDRDGNQFKVIILRPC